VSDGVPLKEHIERLLSERDRQYAQRFDAQEKAVASALAAAKEAVLKAEAASDRRFESVNEFRQTLTDQAATFAPRAEVDLRFASLEKDRDHSAGRGAGLNAMWGYVVGAAGLVVAVVALLK